MGLSSSFLKKPAWIRTKAPSGETWKQVERILAAYRLKTVCDHAQCPNKGECWGAGTAAFMILGDTCTRACRFCAVATARNGEPPRPDEGAALARAVGELGLAYVTLTSVDRDDLPDRGAGHFASCVAALKEAAAVVVEALIPDYTEGELAPIIRAAPDVVSHNIETVRSLQGAVRDPRASFDRSLAALRHAKALGAPATKTSLLVGLGEKPAEVLAAMDEIRGAEVDMLVIGQYLRPSSRHIPVAEYVAPERFALYARAAQERGFAFTAASPLARTSYRAFEGWKAACPEAGGNITVEALGKPAGCKLIRVRAEFGGGVIRAIRIRGDFFASPEEAFEQVERELAGAAPEEVAARFDRFIRSAGVEVSGISGAALEILLRGALEERRILL